MHLRPDQFEILVARELRKAGLALPAVRAGSRRALSKERPDDYAMDVGVLLRVGGADRPVLVECRSQEAPATADDVAALHARLPARRARHGIMCCTAGYEPDAVRRAREAGVALLTVSDGRAAFARSAWGVAGEPPAWVPDHMAEVVELDDAGALRHHLLVAGTGRLVLERLGV